MTHPHSLLDFYREIGFTENAIAADRLTEDIRKEIGHFNVFQIGSVIKNAKAGQGMPYNRRTYYKISLMNGRNRVEYADKSIDIIRHGLLFASPKIPYHYLPQDEDQSGFFCVFTTDFLSREKTGMRMDELPLFRPGGFPVFEIGTEQAAELQGIFQRMSREMESDYSFKYDLIRNYVMELIHFGQKLEPKSTNYQSYGAADRIAGLFVELLERQFPVTSSRQQPELRTAKDYADRLAVHVNHLNKVLKESTGKTTTELISLRLEREARILLRHTDWNIAEISDALGFEETAHFSNFFKKHSGKSPSQYRVSAEI
ncbi:MAG: helix-turn-helix transcriptional regulator [Chitinophagaceae bacterium]